MKKVIVLVVLMVLGYTIQAHAMMETIGTATYGGSDYNLIWDDDNNGNSVVWLDYTNAATWWDDQNTWAAGLDGALTYNIDPGYTLTWTDADWRLPTTEDGPEVFGYDGTTTVGYNITNGEMGHLYYTELGNKGYYATDGTNPQSGWGLSSTGDFQNLTAFDYWSSTERATAVVWVQSFNSGLQYTYHVAETGRGLAVRSGEVSAADPVPEPATIALLGIGLVGMAGYGVRRRRQRR